MKHSNQKDNASIVGYVVIAVVSGAAIFQGYLDAANAVKTHKNLLLLVGC